MSYSLGLMHRQNDRSTKWTKITLKLIVLLQSLTIFNWLIPIICTTIVWTYSTMRRLIWSRSRITLLILGRSHVTQKPFATLFLPRLSVSFDPRPPPPGEKGLPYKKYGGAHRKFWKEPLIGTKILFCGRGLKFFSPLRGTNFKTKYLKHWLSPTLTFFGSIPWTVPQKLPWPVWAFLGWTP